MTRILLVNMSWLLWSAAMLNLTVTHMLSIWFPAEVLSLCLICVGFIWGIAALAAITKYGAEGILKPALAGIGLNGILLAIAIPNFIHGRNEALQLEAKSITQAQTVEARNIEPKSTADSWKEYNIAGVQLVSPVALNKKEIPAAEPSQPVELYMGQLLPSAFTVVLTRRELAANEDYALEDVAAEAADMVRQRFPQGFESSSSEAQVDGIPARRQNMQYITHSTPAQETTMIFVKQPFIWEVRVAGPKNLPGLDADTDRVLNSIKLVPVQTASNVAR